MKTALRATLTLLAAVALSGPSATADELFLTSAFYGAGQGAISQFTTSGSLVNGDVVNGLEYPRAIAASGGDLFVADFVTSTIGEYTTAGGVVNASLVSGLGNPEGVAVWGNDIFVTNWGSGTVGEYTTSGATVNASLITGLDSPYGIVVSGGNLYVADETPAGTIGEYTTTGNVVNASLVTGLGSPTGITSSGGDLFVLNSSTGTIGEYTASGSAVDASLVSGLDIPLGIAISGADLYVTNWGSGTVGEYTTSGATVDSSLFTSYDSAGIAVVQTPEPSTCAMLLIGGIALVATRSFGNRWRGHARISRRAVGLAIRAALLGCGVLALSLMPQNAGAGEVLFSDSFDGPTLNPVWQASFPNAPLGANPATYEGAPGYSFQTLDGDSVLNLSESQTDLQRVGWSTSTVFTAPDFLVEARFNTLDQSAATGIDGVIELSLIDAANPQNIDIARLFGSNSATTPYFQTDSTIDGSSVSTNYSYQNDTWYTLAFSGSATQDITASLLSDSGATLLSYTFDETTAAFPSGFRVGLSQSMGFPNPSIYPSGYAPSLVDVGNVQVIALPEPASLLLIGIGAAGLAFAASNATARRPAARWRRRSMASEPE